MRLKEIKLAGFKSFVDPTSISIPGQIVGVVGPNGCGKSNVIDAVRWVLGESSARHLRGETMQDVIFNGAGDRRPGNRASVELVFDNALGKAGGQWASYAEIGIRRVLERDGNSEYYINGVQVRRRDITDLFLGTGVGARAYGIIEQGMISQVIEARPEDLRVFLEEAAGVSKYRERRRETELRLSETRDNLSRVNDIRQELESQLTRLEAQAEVASRYHDLQAQLATTQNLLRYTRRQEAAATRTRVARDIDRFGIELESETAKLRESERRIEELKVEFYEASDRVSAVQGGFYQAGAEVSRLEQRVQYLRDSKARAEAQRAEAEGRADQVRAQQESVEQDLARWRAQLQQATGQLERLMVRVAAESERLPVFEQSYREVQARAKELQSRVADLDRSIEVGSTRLAHADRLLEQFATRHARLSDERKALPPPDNVLIAQLRSELAQVNEQGHATRARIGEEEGRLSQAESSLQSAGRAADEAVRELTAHDARKSALEALQARIVRGGSLQAWLEKHDVSADRRLFHAIRIEPGWEDAAEAVLGDRLSAIRTGTIDVPEWQEDLPPARVTFFAARAGETARAAPIAGLDLLASHVSCSEPELATVVADWLHLVYVAADPATALAARDALPTGACVVTRAGHVFSRHAVRFHSAEPELQGVLARQREIAELATHIEALRLRVEQARDDVRQCETHRTRVRDAIAGLRSELERCQERQHSLQLESVRLTEQAERASFRGAQIARELAEIETQRGQESEARAALSASVVAQKQSRDTAGSELEGANAALRHAESALAEQRAALQEAEKESQEAVFAQRSCTQKIADLDAQRLALDAALTDSTAAIGRLAEEAARYDDTTIAEELQRALSDRQEKEDSLALARDEQQRHEAALREVDTVRASAEQRIDPLRNRLGDLRLKEQEARLIEEQYARELADAAADEAALAALIEKGVRSGAFVAEIARLGDEITALGAVNLAALEELTAARERKNYLDSQSGDLEQALLTLENAIRRIDRETRDLLMATFDAVNRHFGELFPALFGGGQAKLLLTGEEILDSGVQVVAQPPGKRNASIHLLSGEKALTALALVFSMFQLNPAPFCLLDEVDAPLDDTNTERFCDLVRRMSAGVQFLFISHNKITMEIAEQLIGVTMQEQGVSRVVAVDIEEALKLSEKQAA